MKIKKILLIPKMLFSLASCNKNVNKINNIDINSILKEINEYYFTKKIFKGVESFSNKLDLKYILLMDNKEWKI